MPDTDWKDRYVEVQADRDYWRSRAESWEGRYVECAKQNASLAAKIVTEPTEAPDEKLPAAIEMALQKATSGQPKDVARNMRREAVLSYAQATGHEDERVRAALNRLHEGDASRVAAFLGEGV